MAKVVKRKRRKLSLIGFSIIFLTASLIAWLLTSLFINTTNSSLTIKIQKMNEEIASIKSENQNLNIEIQTLGNKDRVYVIAQESNMLLDNSNVISVSGE